MAELNRKRRQSAQAESSRALQYSAAGHPPVEQLVSEQGTGPITDVSALHGDFWPEEESIEEFLATLRDWRGRDYLGVPGLNLISHGDPPSSSHKPNDVPESS